MNIFVKVKPKMREERVVVIDNTHYTVSLKAVAQEGKANEALIKVLSAYFKTPKTHIAITAGFTSKNKTVSILL